MTARKIINRLNEVFVEFDNKVLVDSKKWAVERVVAIREFKQSDEAMSLRRDQFAYYEKSFCSRGSAKSWYNVILMAVSIEMINELMEKNHRVTIEKRNASITKKLEKVGVTEVIDEEFVYTKDGFNGVFAVNTDVGIKRVTIDTIYAGGYNIQCLHLRVLVKVK